ncbi:thiolase family protein [Roseibium aggregatum]|uniref:Thiolase family protein n=1 Tax=Roseibium aggregatum TaxID=187304 RepID=A0A926S8P3_9HYPH|nr:thiolase family protein [Roseibium aggregatum]MBD1549052.1 thiolase family protein [Roseibium aggregatum]
MTGSAVIVAARRTAVAPRGGAFRHLQADELAAPVIEAVLADAGLAGTDVDQVILGNALYGGGNPARLAALRAGLPETVPAMTIDTQCCSGLDAILQAVRLVEAGAADCVLAGGAESFSRSAIRMHRPNTQEEIPVAYDRPPFSPWPDRDPDLSEAAADLARLREISREAQAAFAVESHRKALAYLEWGKGGSEIVPVAGLSTDAFARKLDLKTALRAPVIAGDRETGVTAATTAVEADSAAIVAVLSEKKARDIGRITGLLVLEGVMAAGDPTQPALAPQIAIRQLAEMLDTEPNAFDAVELMEAYAVQALATVTDLRIDPARVNLHGGALSRGHPIGASGAILAVRLFHDLKSRKAGQTGLAAIAAAGGLGTAVAVQGIDLSA